MTKIISHPPSEAKLSPTGTTVHELFSSFQVIEHRGLPTIFPEQTVEAFDLSVASGARWLEFDCHLLKDESLGVMHDDTVDRSTTSTGNTIDLCAASWKRLVADICPSGVVDVSVSGGNGFTTSTVPLASDIVAKYGNRIPIFIEAKSTISGRSGATGLAIVQMLQRFGVNRSMAVVNSYYAAELAPALAAGYLTCLNFADAYPGSYPTPAQLVATGYWAVCVLTNTPQAQLDALRAAGLKVIGATPDRFSQLHWWQNHSDAVFSNNAPYLSQRARRSKDNFSGGIWECGKFKANSNGDNNGMGAYYADKYWGYDLHLENTWAGSTMGWANPIGGVDTSDGTSSLPACTLTWSVKMESALNDTRGMWVALLKDETAFAADDGLSHVYGYEFWIRKDGAIYIFRLDDGTIVTLGNNTSSAIADGGTAQLKATITATTVKLERLDVAASVTVTDNTYRGAFLHAGVKGVFGKFYDFSVSTT